MSKIFKENKNNNFNQPSKCRPGYQKQSIRENDEIVSKNLRSVMQPKRIVSNRSKI